MAMHVTYARRESSAFGWRTRLRAVFWKYATVFIDRRCGLRALDSLCKNVCVPWYSQLANLHHGSPAVKWKSSLYYCCSCTIPLVRMTTVRLKLPYIAKFSQISRIHHVREGQGPRNEPLSLCLEVEGILVLCNLADSFAKFYSWTLIYIYILTLYIYIYSMKVDYMEMVPVVPWQERECL